MDIRLLATGPCERPAYEDPCHITWCMTVHVYQESACYGVRGSRRALGKAGEREKYARVPDARTASGSNGASPKVPQRKQDPRGYAECGYVDGPLVRVG
ncbi:unnamed protein product [Heligmosomoides polygyrus]|uniref:Uncharacterized protein n=1 Tax=Heligmosomoides polygyrus TaxID=6339 RepID=A0A183GHN3_HELPZ|nr:unnamed protein product [Heligmosomoides polygyrus]